MEFVNNKRKRNRERVRKHRLQKKLRILHNDQVNERIRSIENNEEKSFQRQSEDINVGEGVKVDEDVNVQAQFGDRLRIWAIEHNITGCAINDLLKILIFAGFTNLPKDSRTFKNTPTNLPIRMLSHGKMWYNGLKKSIENVMFTNINRDLSITLDFNFDGIPVFKSSNLTFWPILVSIRGDFQNLFDCFSISNMLTEVFIKLFE